MKHSQVLKRAWKILWSYRALWIFGAILALTAGTLSGQTMFSGGRDDFDNQSQSTVDWNFSEDEPFWPQFFDFMGDELDEARHEFDRLLTPGQAKEWERNVLRAAITFTAVMLVLFLTLKILRFPAEVALVKMVDSYEESGEKVSVRTGWQMGWSRPAWRIFLVDLAIGLPALILFFVVMGIALTPILSASIGSPTRGALGLVASIGLMILFSFLAILYAAVFSLVKPVIYRKVVLENLGIGASFREGFRMFGQYWKEYGLLWLIMVGINLLWPLVMFPFALLTGVIGLTLGGGTALLAGGRAIESGDPAMVWPIMIGILILVGVVAVPMAFITGLRETFQSSSWTLAYRELNAIKSLNNGDLPAVEAETA